MYAIVKDLTDDSFWLTNQVADRAEGIKAFQSDSMHECFEWFFRKHYHDCTVTGVYFKKDLYTELQDEFVWCVYWSDFDENYYICPDKGDGTLDDVCFKGSEEECDKWFDKHYFKN